MNLRRSWRFRSIAAGVIIACTVAVSTLMGRPTSVCAAGLQGVPCGYARFEGKVSAADTGEVLAGATITVASTTVASYASTTQTDAGGLYSVDVPVALVGNHFSLRVTPGFSNDRYLAAEPVAVRDVLSGTTQVNNFTLDVGATITGKVTSAKDGTPLAGTMVSVLRYDEESGLYIGGFDFDTVNASGVYTIEGLESGVYALRFQPLNASIYHMSLYSGGAYHVEDAELFTLTAPAVLQQDMVIGIGAQIAGVVRRADNNMPVAGARISVTNTEDEPHLVASALTFFGRSDDSGTYLFTGLPPGQYRVWAIPDFFFEHPENKEVLGAYYGDSRLAAEADLVTATEEDLGDPPLSGIDINLPLGAKLTGRVVDAATGTPLENVTVSVSQTIMSDLPTSGVSVKTDASGVYTMTGLDTGVAQIFFQGLPEYLRQGYDLVDLAPFQFDGELVEVTIGETVSGIDGALNKASRLSGRVTDPDGNPINNVAVRLEMVQDPSVFYETTTNVIGEYSSPVLPGDYRVRFSRNVICGCYNREYYANGDEPAVVKVDALAEVEGIDIALACGTAPPLETPLEYLFMPKLAAPDQ